MAQKKAKANVMIVNFKVPSEAYQAFVELRHEAVDDFYVIGQAAIVKNEKGKYVVKDSFDTGSATLDDTMKGGLVGALVGILGGPVGVLLGGGVGSLIGEAKDSYDAVKGFKLIDCACDCITEGETAVVLLVDEQYEQALTKKLSAFDTTITRLAAADVQAEVEHAEKVERELAKAAEELYYEQKAEEVNQDLTDMYNRTGNSFKL